MRAVQKVADGLVTNRDRETEEVVALGGAPAGYVEAVVGHKLRMAGRLEKTVETVHK